VQTKPLWSLLDHDQYLELPRTSNKSGPDLWGWGARGVGAGSSGGRAILLYYATTIQHTVRYTKLSPDRFRDFWRELSGQRNSQSDCTAHL
jgi:hypothetical protein